MAEDLLAAWQTWYKEVSPIIREATRGLPYPYTPPAPCEEIDWMVENWEEALDK